jgi:hypothetical protein
MDYKEFRQIAETGGILGTSGKKVVGMFIRIFTGASLQHVAIVFWMDEGLFVAEFQEGVGFQMMPASQWFKNQPKKVIFYGKPPEVVKNKEELVKRLIFEVRDSESRFKTNYNYWELPIVWFANIFNLNVKGLSGVCSSFVNRIYSKCGYPKKMQVPGDLFEMGLDIETVKYEG